MIILRKKGYKNIFISNYIMDLENIFLELEKQYKEIYELKTRKRINIKESRNLSDEDKILYKKHQIKIYNKYFNKTEKRKKTRKNYQKERKYKKKNYYKKINFDIYKQNPNLTILENIFLELEKQYKEIYELKIRPQINIDTSKLNDNEKRLYLNKKHQIYLRYNPKYKTAKVDRKINLKELIEIKNQEYKEVYILKTREKVTRCHYYKDLTDEEKKIFTNQLRIIKRKYKKDRITDATIKGRKRRYEKNKEKQKKRSRETKKTRNGKISSLVSRWKNKYKFKDNKERLNLIAHNYLNCKKCELCNKEFTEEYPYKCCDHHHSSGYFRFICCVSCNVKLGVVDRLKSFVLLEIHKKNFCINKKEIEEKKINHYHQNQILYRWVYKYKLKDNFERLKLVYYIFLNCKKCELCNKDFNEDEKKNLDHCHSSGYFRFICCSKCNNNLIMVDKYKRRVLLELHRYFILN